MAATRVLCLLAVAGSWADSRRLARTWLPEEADEADVDEAEADLSQNSETLECFICLEATSAVASLGCSCRGSQPGAHLSCLKEQYVALLRDADMKKVVKTLGAEAGCCKTCRVEYKADVLLALAQVGLEEVERRPTDTSEKAEEKKILRNYARPFLGSAWAAKADERRINDSLEHGLLLGEESAFVLDTVYNYSETALAASLFDESLSELLVDFALPPVHPGVVRLTENYATQLNRMGQHWRATNLLWDVKEALDMARLDTPISFMHTLVRCISHQKKRPARWWHAEVTMIKMINTNVAFSKLKTDARNDLLQSQYCLLAENLVCQGKYADAAVVLGHQLALVRKRMGENSTYSKLVEAWMHMAQRKTKSLASGRYAGQPPYDASFAGSTGGPEFGACIAFLAFLIFILCRYVWGEGQALAGMTQSTEL